MIAFLIVCNVISLLLWIRGAWFVSMLRAEITAAQSDMIDSLQDQLRSARAAIRQNANEASKWFRCTRIAHARRKRLHKVTDRLFARIALDGIELAMAEGRIDDVSAERDLALVRCEGLVQISDNLSEEVEELRERLNVANQSYELVSDRANAAEARAASAIARARELGEEAATLIEQRDAAIENQQRFASMIHAASGGPKNGQRWKAADGSGEITITRVYRTRVAYVWRTLKDSSSEPLTGNRSSSEFSDPDRWTFVSEPAVIKTKRPATGKTGPKGRKGKKS